MRLRQALAVIAIGMAGCQLSASVTEKDIRQRLEAKGVSQPVSLHMAAMPNACTEGAFRVSPVRMLGNALWISVRGTTINRCRPFVVKTVYSSSAESREAWRSFSSSVHTRDHRPLLRAGSSLQLVLVHGAMRMSLRATSLESGAAGQNIRVRDAQKRIYMAVVESKDRVVMSW